MNQQRWDDLRARTDGETADDLQHRDLGLGLESVTGLHLDDRRAGSQESINARLGEREQVLRRGCRCGANRAPDSATRRQNAFVGHAGNAGFEVCQTIPRPHSVRVRIDQARNHGAVLCVEDGRGFPVPIGFRSDPENLAAGDGQRRLLDDFELSHRRAVFRPGALRRDQLRNASEEQIGFHGRLGISTPRSRATPIARS